MNIVLPSVGDVAESAAETIAVLDMTVKLRVSSAQTHGAWSLSEWRVPPYCAGLPIHWHAHTQKLCYLLDGMLAWTIDQHTFTATTNDCITIRPGVRHSFFNPAAAPATLLVWSLPGGIEQAIASAVRLPSASRIAWEQYDYFCDRHR